MIHSIFLNEFFVKPEKQKGYWVKEYNFYEGQDLSTIDLKTDWRFMEIPGKRKEAKFLGIAHGIYFPIQYPIKLTNGSELNKL